MKDSCKREIIKRTANNVGASLTDEDIHNLKCIWSDDMPGWKAIITLQRAFDALIAKKGQNHDRTERNKP